jgi:signal peptidase I
MSLLGLVALSFRPFELSGSSMQPNLQSGDTIVGLRYFTPKRGDIVSYQIRDGGSFLISRVVGTPNDVMIIDGCDIYINDELLHESYNTICEESEIGDQELSTTLDEDEYYLIGDNRLNSRDSRDFGPVSRDSIRYKIVFD